MAKVSIITINLNNKAGLEKTIESVIGQTYNDFEYIVIDGCSADDSVDIIKQNQDKIAKWVSEKDSGIYDAMNKGIGKASGEYILFLNAGDYFFNHHVLETVFKIPSSEDIIYGDMMIDRGVSKLEYGHSPDPLTFEGMIESTLWHPVSFIRKSLFDKYGLYNTRLKIVSDYEFFLKVLFIHNVSYKHISLPVSVFKTDGIGSIEAYDTLHKEEKLSVQLKYFSVLVIDSANRFNELKKSKAVYIGNWLVMKPMLYKIMLKFYKIIKAL
jgi:glycosyltransferase involved in cell wall biosynthesis